MQVNMQISLNGETKSITDACLANALKQLGYDDEGFAVAVNGEFVPRPTYEEFVLDDGDLVDIVAPIAGG